MSLYSDGPAPRNTLRVG